MVKSKKSMVIPDQDEINDGISYEKGREFEEEFASFMKEHLEWKKVRVGAHLSGKHNSKGANIDIIAERLDELGLKQEKMCYKWMGVSAIFVTLTTIWHSLKIGQNGHWFVIISLLSLLGVIIFAILSAMNNKQNAWVECKNLKGKATINHISKMIREFQDHKRNKDDCHKFTHYYFVSANGYVENALKMAIDNNIICFIKKGDTFEEISYWN